jgi:REP element-mobilizing transposase RayT
VVFSTKYRKPLIPIDRREALYEYFGGIARNHKIKLITAGGNEDHVHLLIAIGTTTTIAENVQKLKTYSSKWMREAVPDFLWQDGFSVFSVSPSQVPVVRLYIARQIEHHRKRDFNAEFAALLRKCGVRVGTDEEAPNPDPTTAVVG